MFLTKLKRNNSKIDSLGTNTPGECMPLLVRTYIYCIIFIFGLHKQTLFATTTTSSAADQLAPLQDIHSIAKDFNELDQKLTFIDVFNASPAFMVLLASSTIIAAVCLATISYSITTDWIVEPARKLYRSRVTRHCCTSSQSDSIVENNETDFLLANP